MLFQVVTDFACEVTSYKKDSNEKPSVSTICMPAGITLDVHGICSVENEIVFVVWNRNYAMTFMCVNSGFCKPLEKGQDNNNYAAANAELIMDINC